MRRVRAEQMELCSTRMPDQVGLPLSGPNRGQLARRLNYNGAFLSVTGDPLCTYAFVVPIQSMIQNKNRLSGDDSGSSE